MLDCSNRDKKMATGGDLLGVRKENINFEVILFCPLLIIYLSF